MADVFCYQRLEQMHGFWLQEGLFPRHDLLNGKILQSTPVNGFDQEMENRILLIQ